MFRSSFILDLITHVRPSQVLCMSMSKFNELIIELIFYSWALHIKLLNCPQLPATLGWISNS